MKEKEKTTPMMIKLEAVTPRAARWIPMQKTPSVNTYVGIIQTHHFSSASTSFCLEFLFALRFNIKNQMLRLAQSNLLKPAYDFFFHNPPIGTQALQAKYSTRRFSFENQRNDES